MSEPEFGLAFETDKRTGEILAVYFQIRRGKSDRVQEVVEGTAFADYDRKGRLLGVELLAPCKVNVFDLIAKKEPAKYQKSVKKFLTDSTPRKMTVSA